jgi:DNA-binding MarR family transcriptional regulator
MERKQEFFAHATKANLSGEQARVLLCLLSKEADGDISLRQNEVAEILGMAESNVSRSIKALKEAGLLSKKDADGYDGKPVLVIDKAFSYGPVDAKYLV